MQFALLSRALEERIKRRRIDGYYPDDGPLRRALYPKHIDFFRAGATNRERLFLAANRIGKTEGAGGYEVTLHLTGQYPHWWQGRRFNRATRVWAVGESSREVRDTIQRKLVGEPGDIGTGLIPGDAIVKTVTRSGVPDGIDKVIVEHETGRQSTLTFKSYEQGREAFQADEIDVVWLDEECPQDIYNECLIRTMTTDGIVMLTFTPLKGLTPLIMQFLPGGKIPAQ